LGLLIEEQRTNIQTYSGSATGWTFNNNTTPNLANAQGIAPDGTNTAVGIPYGATGNVQSNLTVTSDTNTYTFSFYAKSLTGAGTITTGTLGFPPPNNYFAGTIFNFSTLALGTGWSATAVGNGWYRLSRSFINTSQTTFINAISTTTGVVLFWGPQLELGTFATSYIATTSASATRTADRAFMTGANFSNWFNAGQGSFIVNAARAAVQDSTGVGGYGRILGNDTGTNSFLEYAPTTNVLYVSGVGSYYFAVPSLNTSGSIFNNFAVSYGLTGISVTANNATVQINSSATMATSNSLYILATGNGAYSTSGLVKRIAYYPIQVTSTNMQALTS
jgi:hypothetical protein